MKHLSIEEFDKAPNIVKFVYLSGSYNVPIGYRLYNECKEKHPEYFDDEVIDEKSRKEFDDYWNTVFIKDDGSSGAYGGLFKELREE